MDTVSLSIAARDTARSAKVLRREALVPCILYGNKVANTQLQADHNTLFKAFVKAGESTVVELTIGEGKPVPVLFHAINFDPVTDQIIHVDFYAVDMNKEIETHVPLHFIGESPAVKELGGTFVGSLDHVTVRCLPAKLPHAIEIDISGLKEFGDIMTVSELPKIDGVEYMIEDMDLPMASVQAPREAEPETAPTEASAEGAAAPAEGAEGEKKEESAS